MNEVFTEEHEPTAPTPVQPVTIPIPAQDETATNLAQADEAIARANHTAPLAPVIEPQRRLRRSMAEEPIAYLMEHLNLPENMHHRPEGVKREGEDIYDDLVAYKTMQRFARTAKRNQKNKNVRLSFRTYLQYWRPLREAGWFERELHTANLTVSEPIWNVDLTEWTHETAGFPTTPPETSRTQFVAFLARIGVTPEMTDSWAPFWNRIFPTIPNDTVETTTAGAPTEITEPTTIANITSGNAQTDTIAATTRDGIDTVMQPVANPGITMGTTTTGNFAQTLDTVMTDDLIQHEGDSRRVMTPPPGLETATEVSDSDQDGLYTTSED